MEEVLVTDSAAANEYNPFDQVEDIIQAPNDGSFHHVPSSEEQLQANY